MTNPPPPSPSFSSTHPRFNLASPALGSSAGQPPHVASVHLPSLAQPLSLPCTPKSLANGWAYNNPCTPSRSDQAQPITGAPDLPCVQCVGDSLLDRLWCRCSFQNPKLMKPVFWFRHKYWPRHKKTHYFQTCKFQQVVACIDLNSIA